MNFFNANKIFSLIRSYKQKKKINKLLSKGKLAVTAANSTFKFNSLNNVKDKYFVFTDVKPDQYEIVINHKNKDLYGNRKLMWASFELSGAAISEYIAKKLRLSLGKYGMFTYVGGGRTREGLYRSSSSIHIYKRTPFVIVKLHTNYKDNLEIKEIGLIGKNQSLNRSISSCAPNTFIIDGRNIINKLEPIINYNTYIVYANISPNIADGSSIWMASIVDILATNHKVILLLKENLRSEIIISNIINKDNVTIIQPSDYSNNIEINEQQALEVIRKIDFVHPRLRGVLVRGIIAAN
ncbi:hypothetical protein, partial [Rodentibacter rarus]|uniref:hypothetical protein n=1 Tax=Rodentibacter rarus TaxID=1908260 RepID=UPI00117AB1D0